MSEEIRTVRKNFNRDLLKEEVEASTLSAISVSLYGFDRLNVFVLVPSNEPRRIARSLNDDGTYTEYLHLAQRSSTVAKGDKITKGQVIATTGLSGFIEIPHLHFNRFRIIEDDSGRRAESIPFKMVYRTRDKVETVLENLW